MENSYKSVRLGCFFLVIVIILALYFVFVKDSPDEKKAKAELVSKLAEYKSKFNYDVDSIAKTIHVTDYESNQDKIKEKYFLLEDQGGQYVVNAKFMSDTNTRIPDELIAYKLKDLNTIIIYKCDRVQTSEWGAPSVERDEAELSFYDVSSSKILYQSKLVGSGKPSVVERGRRAGAKIYYLSDVEIIDEIIRIIEHKKNSTQHGI